MSDRRARAAATLARLGLDAEAIAAGRIVESEIRERLAGADGEALVAALGELPSPAVATGTYTLKFELSGFAPLVRSGIIVPVRQTITVDAQMKLAALQETVTVSSASPSVKSAKTIRRLLQLVVG